MASDTCNLDLQIDLWCFWARSRYLKPVSQSVYKYWFRCWPPSRVYSFKPRKPSEAILEWDNNWANFDLLTITILPSSPDGESHSSLLWFPKVRSHQLLGAALRPPSPCWHTCPAPLAPKSSSNGSRILQQSRHFWPGFPFPLHTYDSIKLCVLKALAATRSSSNLAFNHTAPGSPSASSSSLSFSMASTHFRARQRNLIAMTSSQPTLAPACIVG